MKSQMKTILTTFKQLSLILLGSTAGLALYAGEAEAPAAASQDTTKYLETVRKKYKLPGFAVVVVKDGVICDRAATGVRAAGHAELVTTNDLFHIGSCTKSMTATLAAMLIEDGKLRWDTTVAEIFPEWKGKMDPGYESVTVEQLLQHRGGLAGEPPSGAWTEARKENGTPTEQRLAFVEAALKKAPKAAPGTKMIYSNQGYALVGAMIEKVTGQPYEELITAKLFKPLHMDSAGFGPPGTRGKFDQPWGHKRTLGLNVPLQEDNPPAIAPAGRVHCSLDDMARYTIAHMEGEKKGGLLKPETFLRLHTPPEKGDYACGWVCVRRGWAGGRAMMHNGSNTMWYIVMWLAPKKDFSVIVATNIGEEQSTFQGCDDVAGAMIDKWLGK